MKPNIFICGQSGSGKSTSLRNLDPEKTIILNTERKALPFKGAGKFKKQMMIKNLDQYERALKKALASDAEVIVTDSFTTLTEYIYLKAKETKIGYEVWSYYADEIYNLLSLSKGSDKFVVFLGIDENVQDDTGVITKYIKVEGKKSKTAIEKEFTIVLWSKVITSGDAPKHVLQTNNNGENTSKSPMEMFKEMYIDNDLQAILAEITNYYEED